MTRPNFNVITMPIIKCAFDGCGNRVKLAGEYCKRWHRREGVQMAAFYAAAEDSDLAAQPWQQVRAGKLWSGYVGTICGRPVGTETGTLFATRAAALANAKLMREQCRAIQKGEKP